ncbi:hypothetical protein DIPPA_18968 [Diplonema papillatum]|nr:hypothetical protein DIPPA_18968 [Diplonema papillatum]
MPLMLKFLHVCVYLKIRDLCIERIKAKDFQYGCQRQHATLEILQRAEEWMDGGDEEDPAVVIADIEAAYPVERSVHFGVHVHLCGEL